MGSAAAPAASAGKATPAPAGIDVASLPCENPMLLAIGTMTASLIQILDTTIANVAIPHMQSALGATSDEISWVLTSYIVAVALAMPLTGWLADRVGSRRLFMGSVAGFVVTSMLCGMAQNVTQMVVFRALQGATGAFISPLSQSTMIDTNKPSRQAQMMAIWGMGIMIGPIMGPILGGWLTENWNWRSVFYVNVPLGALALAIMAAELPSRPIVRRRFDLFGYALVAVALTAVQLLLDRGNHVDWFDSGEIWIYLGVALSCGWVGVIHLATAPAPLFDRRLFGDGNYVFALAFTAIVGLVMFANMALLPPMLQRLFGYGVIDTGMVLMPRGVGTLIAMQFSGWLMRRGHDPRMAMAVGFVITGFSLWQMTGWSLAADYQLFATVGFIQGIGLGLVFIPLNASAFATLPPELRTDGASLLNLLRSIGSSVGISVVITLLARNVQVSHSDLAGHVTSSATTLIDISALDRFQAAGDAALRMIDGEVTRQAGMVAYLDDFKLMMWLTFATVPFIALMRRADLSTAGRLATARQQSETDAPPVDLPH